MTDIQHLDDVLKKAISVEVLDYPRLRITYEDGLSGVLDLTDTIAERKAFAPLKDPDLFARARLIHGGGGIVWGDEIVDLDAGAQRPHLQVETRARA